MRRCIALLLILLSMGLSLPTEAQGRQASSVDVFLLQDREAQQLEVFFADPATGLSAISVIDNFPATANPLDELLITANGVMYRDSITGLPRLISPTGRLIDITFIPQNLRTPERIDYVVSDDRRTLAWAETEFTELGWQSVIYVSDLVGNNLRTLPERPIEPVQASRRIEMMAVSNDGQRVFFDAEHPPQLETTALFQAYQRITAYSSQFQSYLDMPAEPNCLCDGLIANNGQTMVRLVEAPNGNGYSVHNWNLENNDEIVVPALDTGYELAGDLLINRQGSIALYVIATITDDGLRYGLVYVDFGSRQQRVLLSDVENRIRPMAFIDRNISAIVVDIDAQVTYKIRFDVDEFNPVAEKMWLGKIEG